MSPSSELAAAARDLLESGSSGIISTHSIKHDGYTYTSVLPYILASDCKPLFFISSLATHTRNLKANSKASFLVAPESDNPQATGRVTLLGDVEPVPDDEVSSAKSIYLAAHPEAEQWDSFGDFAMYEMQCVDVYIVAGFGAMGWIKPDELKH